MMHIKGIGIIKVLDWWPVDNESMLSIDFNTLVRVDSSPVNFVLDGLAVGDMTDSCKEQYNHSNVTPLEC